MSGCFANDYDFVNYETFLRRFAIGTDFKHCSEQKTKACRFRKNETTCFFFLILSDLFWDRAFLCLLY